jgi:hypothetical protein
MREKFTDLISEMAGNPLIEFKLKKASRFGRMWC